MLQNTQQLIANYYSAFNDGDMDRFVSLVTEDVIHDINQGARETGRSAFVEFMQKMNTHYREQLENISIMVNEAGDRAAAEFLVVGEYLQTDDVFPEAKGQTYRIPAGAFFEIKEGRIARITNFYNLQDWIDQVR